MNRSATRSTPYTQVMKTAVNADVFFGVDPPGSNGIAHIRNIDVARGQCYPLENPPSGLLSSRAYDKFTNADMLRLFVCKNNGICHVLRLQHRRHGRFPLAVGILDFV